MHRSVALATGMVTFTLLTLFSLDIGGFGLAANDKKPRKNRVVTEPVTPTAAAETKGEAPDAALERTRETVKMLDDLYKTAVVLITDKYVHDEKDFPAGSAAVALFAAMKKKGWHEVRLLDATGDPIIATNAPSDDFEKKAIKALKEGKNYYEEVVKADGKRLLRAATPIPVVSQKCVMCHPQYKDVKAGAPIGALGYTLTIK